MSDTFNEFRKQVQHHQRDLRQAQNTVLYAQHIIRKEKDIGPGQCLRLVDSMRLVEEPLHKCYELVASSKLLPLPVKSRRHPLLIILGYTNQLLQDLIPSIDSLHIICKTASQQQANVHRQYILEQLDALAQSESDVVDTIDCLLLDANPEKSFLSMNFDPELGVRRLYDLFKDRSLQPAPELALLEARLQRNVQNKRKYGENPANTTEWNQIVESLIQITTEELGVSFNELCHLRPTQNVFMPSVKPKGNDEDTDDPLPPPNYARRQNWAVFVGANTYEDQAHYPSLQVCAADATALAQQFVVNGFFDERIQVITDDNPNNRPTRGNILNSLNTVAAATRPDDLLLFYYSGHGDVDENESYLVSCDGWAATLQHTAVSFSAIKQIMQRAPARNKVIILDACHAGVPLGSKGQKHMSPAFIRRVFEEAEGFVVLSSCAQNQLSYQSTQRGQSIYTYFLLQALGGQADNEEKDLVTVRDINNYVTDKVKNWAVQQKCIQSPTISSEMSGEIIVCSYA